MKPFNVVFTEVVEHTVRVYADSANAAVYKAIGQVVDQWHKDKWEFGRVETEDNAGYVQEVLA